MSAGAVCFSEEEGNNRLAPSSCVLVVVNFLLSVFNNNFFAVEC